LVFLSATSSSASWPEIVTASAAIVSAIVAAVLGFVFNKRLEQHKDELRTIAVEREKVLEATLARGEERQSLRLMAYGELWSVMRPLALYGGRGDFDSRDAASLSSKLSDWYFSEHGGFLLTTPLRTFYFAFQDLLRAVERTADWYAVRPTDPDGAMMQEEFTKLSRDADRVYQYLDTGGAPDWTGPSTNRIAKLWGRLLKEVVARTDLDEQTRFVVLQQGASVLRTAMTRDVESRLP
jgi:hypothetical protein